MVKRKKLNSATQIILGFLVIIIVGTFLLSLPISSNNGEWFNFIDSFFTSTSAVCVTGLSVSDVAFQFSLFGQIVLLLLIQIGGLGFITLTSLVFLLIKKRITYEERVTIQEGLNQDNVQGVVRLVKNIIILVFVTELIGAVCLAPSMISAFGWGEGIFKSIFMSVSAFCNAGFDILGSGANVSESLIGFAQDVFIILPIMFLIIIGGIGYVVLFDLGNIFKKKKLSLHTKVMLISVAILIFGGAFLFGVLEWNNPETIGEMSVGGKILNCLFASVTPRTAGFSAVDYSSLSQGSIVLTCILMFIGGGSSSTAGGIKITTLLVLLLAIFRTTNSNGDVTFCKKKITNKIVQKSIRVICIALILIILSTLAICMVEGNNVTAVEALFETVSAISTVGLSLGITSSLGVISKIILIILMFVGRVGAITLTVAMGNKIGNMKQDIQYPDAKIMVG